ncbi:MAG TPA: hypothetical protein VHO47_04475 [Candidatus Babeliales bacterium]|nr:hypothetical protein [Candidatus Babeliales bacterium]
MKKISIVFSLLVLNFYSLKAMETNTEEKFELDHDVLSFIDLGKKMLEPKKTSESKTNNSRKKRVVEKEPHVRIYELQQEIRAALAEKNFKEPSFLKDIDSLKLGPTNNAAMINYQKGLITGQECLKKGLDDQWGSLSSPGQEHIEKMISNIKHLQIDMLKEQEKKKRFENEKEESRRAQVLLQQKEEIERKKTLQLIIVPMRISFKSDLVKAAKFHEQKVRPYIELFERISNSDFHYNQMEKREKEEIKEMLRRSEFYKLREKRIVYANYPFFWRCIYFSRIAKLDEQLSAHRPFA